MAPGCGSPSSQSLLVIAGVDWLFVRDTSPHSLCRALARSDLLLDCCRDKNHAKNRNRYRLLSSVTSPHSAIVVCMYLYDAK